MRHAVVITIAEEDKYLICESYFSQCQNDDFAAKTLTRAKAIPQGTQATEIQYPVLHAGVASGATLKIEKKRDGVLMKKCAARFYFLTRCLETNHLALGYHAVAFYTLKG